MKKNISFTSYSFCLILLGFIVLFSSCGGSSSIFYGADGIYSSSIAELKKQKKERLLEIEKQIQQQIQAEKYQQEFSELSDTYVYDKEENQYYENPNVEEEPGTTIIINNNVPFGASFGTFSPFGFRNFYNPAFYNPVLYNPFFYDNFYPYNAFGFGNPFFFNRGFGFNQFGYGGFGYGGFGYGGFGFGGIGFGVYNNPYSLGFNNGVAVGRNRGNNRIRAATPRGSRNYRNTNSQSRVNGTTRGAVASRPSSARQSNSRASRSRSSASNRNVSTASANSRNSTYTSVRVPNLSNRSRTTNNRNTSSNSRSSYSYRGNNSYNNSSSSSGSRSSYSSGGSSSSSSRSSSSGSGRASRSKN